MVTYSVGEPYNPQARGGWPAAGAQWRLSEDGVELALFLVDPAASEVEAVAKGRPKFALMGGEHALILAYRFSPMPWSDAPWQACRQHDLTAGVGAGIRPGKGQAVVVILVDSSTGVVRALRMTAWNAEFAGAVSLAIGRQLRNRSTDAQGAAEIDAWYRRYPNSKTLVEFADIVRYSKDSHE